MMTASARNEAISMPLMRGSSLDELTKSYFAESEITNNKSMSTIGNNPAQAICFTSVIANTPVIGETIGIWTTDRDYLFFIVSDKDWMTSEVDAWMSSITLNGKDAVSLSVDMESDGAFYGINQVAQKYTINRIFDEEKFSVPKTGHGWAAERGNNLIDNIKGFFKGQHSTIIGDNNVKNGPDRIISSVNQTALQIQSKYYKDAAQSIAACFKDGKFMYFDADNKPMAIEVPSDQYDKAVKYMENRIRNGEVQGVNPNDTARAVEIVRKGRLSFLQAKHIAKAGTVESILYDSAHGSVSAATSMGLTAAAEFAIRMWSGESVDSAIKNSVLQGLQSGGTSFVVSVLSSQLSKTGLNTAMIPASKTIVHALGPKVSATIVNAFRPAGNAIYGAAAMQSAAKLLRGNVLTGVVSFAVLSTGEVSDLIQGRISWTQLAKNTSSTAVGILGGSLGYIGGAALGTAIMPGAGTAVGLILSVAAGWGASEGANAIADMIAPDDADTMIQIIESQFSEIATEYFLTEDEVNEAVTNLQGILTANMLKDMYQYKDHETFARQLIEMCIDPVVSRRTYIDLPSEDDYAQYVVDTLEAIYEDLESP